MIKIKEYDITQPPMRKAWKAEFYEFLIDYYQPSLVNAEAVYKAIVKVDNFIKNHYHGSKMLLIKDVNDIQDLKRALLSHRSFAMGKNISVNDLKVIVLDRYIDFLSSPDRFQSNNKNATLATKIQSEKISENEIQKACEGMMKETMYFRRQRNRAIRNQCAERDNYTCQICGFNFEKIYGERGQGFIEVHHLVPMSSYDEEHDIKLEELISLCPNCHSMIHLGGDLIDPDELKRLLTKKEKESE